MKLPHWIAAGTVMFAILLTLMMWGLPVYSVWERGMTGQAQLAQAEQNRQIRIKEAEAELEAAKLDSLAEIERAKGVAEANAIIADGLGGAEGYLRYLWIQQLSKNGQDVIYIPTEAGMPILEAGRLSPAPVTVQ